MAVSSAGLAGGGDGWEKRGSSQRSLAGGVDKTVFATSCSGLEWINQLNWSCDFGVCGRVKGITMYLGPSLRAADCARATSSQHGREGAPTQLVQLTAVPTPTAIFGFAKDSAKRNSVSHKE